ncbi:MAG: hypothetical protein AAF721_00065 [Myxococcota bacterium]
MLCISLALAACSVEDAGTDTPTLGRFASDRLADLGVVEVELTPDDDGITAVLFDADGEVAGTLRDDRRDGGRTVTLERGRFDYTLEHGVDELRFYADGELRFHKTTEGIQAAVHDDRADFHAEAIEIVVEVLAMFAPLQPLRAEGGVPAIEAELSAANGPSLACSLETGTVNPAKDKVTSAVVKKWTCEKSKAYGISMARAQAKCQDECGQACSDTNFEGWDYITSGKDNTKWTCADTGQPIVFAKIKWFCPVCAPPPGATASNDDDDEPDCCVYDAAFACC